MIDSSGTMPEFGRRAHDDAAAREALADIVVAFAFEFERDALGEPGAETLPGGAGQLDVDGVVRQAAMAVTLGDLARQHRAGGAVGVLDRRDDAHRRAAIERGLRLRDQLAVENVVDLVILRFAMIDRDAVRRFRLVEQLRRNRGPWPSSVR